MPLKICEVHFDVALVVVLFAYALPGGHFLKADTRECCFCFFDVDLEGARDRKGGRRRSWRCGSALVVFSVLGLRGRCSES